MMLEIHLFDSHVMQCRASTICIFWLSIITLARTWCRGAERDVIVVSRRRCMPCFTPQPTSIQLLLELRSTVYLRCRPAEMPGNLRSVPRLARAELMAIRRRFEGPLICWRRSRLAAVIRGDRAACAI